MSGKKYSQNKNNLETIYIKDAIAFKEIYWLLSGNVFWNEMEDRPGKVRIKIAINHKLVDNDYAKEWFYKKSVKQILKELPD